MTLRTRLVLLIAGLVACAAAVSGLLSYAATRDEAIATLDRFLDDRSGRVSATPGPPPGSRDKGDTDEVIVVDDVIVFEEIVIDDGVLVRPGNVPVGPLPLPGRPPPPPPGAGPPAGSLGDALADAFDDDDSVFGIVAADGEVLLSSDAQVGDLASDEVLLGTPSFETVSVTDGRYRVRTELLADGARVVSARSTMETDSTLAGVRRRLIAIGIIVTACAAIAGWFGAGLLARPLRRLNAAATEVAATGTLEADLDTEASGEVGELAQSFSSMLGALRASRDEQQRLISDASHELRTPLTTVRANVDMLVGGKLDDDDRVKALRLVRSEVDELTNLADELSELASSDVHVPDIASVDMVELVTRAVEREAERHDRQIDLVAPRHRRVVIKGDAVGLNRAISNLVGNAVKFSEPGTPVLVRLEPGRISVVDRGAGIPRHELDTIFERFHRADEARSLPGSGLGLSIVRETARAHRGDVFARNHPNGATVGFTFA